MSDYISTILIVDDDKYGLDTLEMVLFHEGYHLIKATNGYEALSLTEKHRPDLILLDVMMPVMSGFEVCQHIRDTPDLSEIPIIMLTALDDRQSKLRGIEVGADDFITKPYDRLELRIRVRTITKLNRYRRLTLERTKFEWVVENAPDGYIVIDTNGNISYANRRALFMFGGNPEDATPLDGSFVDIADKHYQRQPHPAWQNWLREPHAHVERFLVRPETNVAPAMWLRVDILNSNLLSINEHLLHVYDVTSEVVGQRLTWAFHTQINHKLRTPLGLFTGYMEILQYELDHVEPNLQPLLVNSFEAGKRLQNHLLDIFNYVDSFGAAKRGAGFSLAECEPLIRQIASDLSLTEVTFDLPFADSVDLLKLTRHSMNLIFTELLTNAKKFHPQNAPMLQIEGRVSGEEVIFSVMDDGQNLPVSELANIWLPYYQAEKYFSGQVPGTGLGLAKVACLIWEVGGRYHALNCEDGAGVCLKLYVPLLESVLFMAGEPAWERWVANEVG